MISSSCYILYFYRVIKDIPIQGIAHFAWWATGPTVTRNPWFRINQPKQTPRDCCWDPLNWAIRGSAVLQVTGSSSGGPDDLKKNNKRRRGREHCYRPVGGKAPQSDPPPIVVHSGAVTTARKIQHDTPFSRVICYKT